MSDKILNYIKIIQRYSNDLEHQKRLIKSIEPFSFDEYKNICIVGYTSVITPVNQKITIIEPAYYDFYVGVDNLNYINKFCYKDNITHFDLLEHEYEDFNIGINPRTDIESNTITIDDAGSFDLIIICALNCVYDCLLGATKNINKHPTILIDIFQKDYAIIYDFMKKFYADVSLCKYNDDIFIKFSSTQS